MVVWMVMLVYHWCAACSSKGSGVGCTLLLVLAAVPVVQADGQHLPRLHATEATTLHLIACYAPVSSYSVASSLCAQAHYHTTGYQARTTARFETGTITGLPATWYAPLALLSIILCMRQTVRRKYGAVFSQANVVLCITSNGRK